MNQQLKIQSEKNSNCMILLGFSGLQQWFLIFYHRKPRRPHHHTLYNCKKKKKPKEPDNTLYVKYSFFVIFCNNGFLFSEDELFGFTHCLGVFGGLEPACSFKLSFTTFLPQKTHSARLAHCFNEAMFYVTLILTGSSFTLVLHAAISSYPSYLCVYCWHF